MTVETSLRRRLADLHAERVATWRPEDLQVNIDQRALLESTSDRCGFIAVGDKIPDFTVLEVDGTSLTLDALVQDGPAVLVLFRFAGCPACNIALPYYNEALAPTLKRLGVPLVAISPQVPERLVEIKRRHALNFLVASDQDNRLAQRLGIVFTASAASQQYAKAKGHHLGEVIGTGTWELPMPTALVIDRDKIVRFADVTPDWMARTEAAPIIEAASALSLVAV